MHDLRKLYRLDLHLLDAICQRLYWSALQGLLYSCLMILIFLRLITLFFIFSSYKQTHDIIFNGLLHIFSKDFDLFYNNNAKTIHFFYEAFSVEVFCCLKFLFKHTNILRILYFSSLITQHPLYYTKRYKKSLTNWKVKTN